jgi:hypothetical protein
MLTGIIGDKEEKHAGKGSHKDEPKTEKVRSVCNIIECFHAVKFFLHWVDLSSKQ